MKAYLLINLGTPDNLSVGAIRRYLREFLMDKYVIDINPVARFFLVNGIIAPFRAPKSFAAYQKIWTSEGSPLLVFGQKLVEALQKKMLDPVYFAMRYGRPSIKSVLQKMKSDGVTEISLLPLYPQYAESSSLSSLKHVETCIAKLSWTVAVKSIPYFYHHPAFISSWVSKVQIEMQHNKYDHVLFTYHGLPQHHLTKLDESMAHCHQKVDCCAAVSEVNKLCYRAQCFETTRQIVSQLGLSSDTYTTAFQSRLGRREWIKPYTDLVIPELADKRGIKNLLVVSPSFVADCLETLEEMGLRGRESFFHSGGRTFRLLPSLNSDEIWVEALSKILTAEE